MEKKLKLTFGVKNCKFDFLKNKTIGYIYIWVCSSTTHLGESWVGFVQVWRPSNRDREVTHELAAFALHHFQCQFSNFIQNSRLNFEPCELNNNAYTVNRSKRIAS